VRSLRALAVSHQLGHRLMGENDKPASLLGRIFQHAETTARYNVYYGKGRDIYDLPGRVVHESIFNTNDGNYRCASTQQGYTPFSTWTRGLAWILCGYPEQMEFIELLSEAELAPFGGKQALLDRFLEVSKAVAEFYIRETPTDGIPYWDTGAPGLVHLGDYNDRPAEPFNEHEPVDSSAAAIGAQGLLRLGRYLDRHGKKEEGARYTAAGLTASKTLFSERISASIRTMRGCFSTPSIIVPTDGITFPRGGRFPAASRPCGVTTTSASWPSIFSASLPVPHT